MSTTNIARLATTGSNTFFGTQTYSGSVYIANDLIVQGSSSIQYISASSVSIGTNIVQLNTANPSVRFAGLTIIDSGSIGGSGSFLYDSVHDEFVFVHRGNGTNITSSHFVLGPETYDSLGNETYLTSNRIPKGTGKEHLVDSNIFDNGTTICLTGNVIGTGTGCFTGNVYTPNLATTGSNTFVNTQNISLTAAGQANGLKLTNLNGGTGDSISIDFSVSGGGNVMSRISANRCTIIDYADIGLAFSTFSGSLSEKMRIQGNGYVGIGTTTPTGYLNISTATPGQNEPHIRLTDSSVSGNGGNVFISADKTGVGYNNLTMLALSYTFKGGTSATNYLTINTSGVSCFAGVVCVPTLAASTSIVSSTYYVNSYNSLSSTPSGQMGVLGHNAISCQQVSNTINQMNSGYYGSFIRQYYNEGITFYTRANAGTAGDVLYGTSPVADGGERLRITSTGIACFACPVCMPMLLASGCVGIGTTTPTDQLSINNGTSNSYATLRLAGSNRGGQINFYNQQYPTAQILVDQSGNVEVSTGVFAGASVTSKLLIANTGGACFACCITSPGLKINSPTYVPLVINSSYGQVGLEFQLGGTGFGGIGSASNFTGAYTGSETDLGLGTNGSATSNIIFATGTGYTRRMTITCTGNVGIGTTSPSQKLEVVGGEIKAGRVDSSNEGGQVSFGRASDNATGWYIDAYGNTSTPSLRFVDVSNSSVRMTVDGCGNVGIATTSPAYKLDVSGATRVGSLLVSNGTTTTWCVGRIDDARANTWYTIYTWPSIYDGAFALAQLGYEDNNGDGANAHAFWMTVGAAYSTGFSTSQIGGATNLCLQRSGQSLQALITGVTDRTGGAYLGYTIQTMIVAS